MSLHITDNLSLLASLAPLRQAPNSHSAQQERGFSARLDQALSVKIPEATTSEKARAMAESLTLQMLQTSLSLAGDGSADASAQTFGNGSLPSVNELLKVYQSSMAESGETARPPTSPVPSQLEELSPVVSVKHELPLSRSEAWLDPIIVRASRRYGVDVGLIKAVIKAESNFNPQAVSHAGARGLMQLMPATARSLGVNDSFDPEQNVMAGTRFLKDMLQRYGGNVDSALAAYNWGPGNVDKKPDRLPSETRNYLARVKQLYSSYSG